MPEPDNSIPGPPDGPPGETWWQEVERFLATPYLGDGPLWLYEPDRKPGYLGSPWIIRRVG